MSAERNARLVAEFFEAFAAGDDSRLMSMLDPDVTWRTPGRSQLAARREGPAEVVEQLRRSAELTDGTYSAEVHDVLQSDNGVVVHYTGRGFRKDREFSFEGLLHFSIRNGRIVSVHFAPLDPEEFEKAWS